MDILIIVRTLATALTPSTELTTITMSDLVEEAFHLHSSLCDDEYFHFGGCVASWVKFTTTKLTYDNGGVETPIDWKNVAFEVRVGTRTGLCYGIFYGQEFTERVNHTMVEVTAYDAMYKLNNVDMSDWYRVYSETHPNGATVMTLLSDAYTQALTKMPFDYDAQNALAMDIGTTTRDSLYWKPQALVINPNTQQGEWTPILSGTVKMGTLLRGICQALGYNAHYGIVDSGSNVYTQLYLHNCAKMQTVLPPRIEPDNYRELEYSSFDSPGFSNVRFGAYGDLYDANNNLTKIYGITGNWCANAISQFETEVQGVLVNDLELHAQALYNMLAQFIYRQFKAVCFSQVASLNKIVRVVDTNGNVYNSRIMQLDIDGLRGATYTHTCLPTIDYFEEQDFGAYNSTNERITEMTGKVNRSELAPVATSGNYNDLSNKPSIPAAQVNSDWNASSGVAAILNKPTIPNSANYLERGAWWVSGSGQNIDNITSGIHFVYTEHGAPTTGTLIAFSGNAVGGYSSSAYCWQIILNYSSGDLLYVRTRNGDNATWGSWKRIARADEIPSSANFVVKTAAEPQVIYVNNGSYSFPVIVRSGIADHSLIQYQDGNSNVMGWIGFRNGYATCYDSTGSGDYARQIALHKQFHVSQLGGTTGYVVIKINSTIAWMMSFRVRLYGEYIADEYVISGYNYPAINGWHAPTAMCQTSDGTARTVYFGYYSGDGQSLYVAIPNRAYTGCDVLDCVNGYYQTDMGGLFTLSISTTLPGVSQTSVTAYPPYRKNESISWSGGTITSSGIARSSSGNEIGWDVGYGSTTYARLCGGGSGGSTGLLDMGTDKWVLSKANNTSGVSNWRYAGRLATARYQCGSAQLNAGSQTLSFSGGAMGGTPIVVVGLAGSQNAYVRVTNRTSSGFTVYASGAADITWMAYYDG